MNRNILTLLAIGLTLNTTPAPAIDATEDLPLLTTKVKSVAVFKNGLAFVLRSGDTSLQDGWARMGKLPQATLGTLYFGFASTSARVEDVITGTEKVTKNAEVINMDELLAANVGHPVKLTCAFGSEARSFEGTLLSVPADRKVEEDSAMPPTRFGESSQYQPPKLNAEFVLIQTTNAGEPRVVSLLKSSILSLEILDKPNVHTSVETEQTRTKIHVGGKLSHAEISIAGLEKGIVWSPSYRIDIADDKEANVELDAIFANDVEDLDNADVSFVVGYPNFAFADVISPMSPQQSVANFVQALGAGGNFQAGRFANVMSQSVMYNSANFDASAPQENTYSVGQPLPGEQGEDLYFYHKNGVTMKKGDRALFNVLKTSVPYEHLYQWEIPDSMNVDTRGFRRGGESTPPENQVWHVLRLENKGEQPWTTAPAFVLNGQLPVAQDTLGYTPPGGRSFLKLTVATDVRAEQSQNETARNQVRIGNVNYEEVTVSGKLKLTNWKNKEIALMVRKSLVGDVLESPDGKVTKVARNLTSVNPNSEIEWDFSLAAGKERELEYQYKVLLER